MAIKLQATKKPTGLSIKRNGTKYVCEWTIADVDYGDGQRFAHVINTSIDKLDRWAVEFLGGKVTKNPIKLYSGHYFPFTALKVKNIKFGIEGDRKKFKYKKNGKEHTYDPAESGFAYKTFDIDPPNAPVLTKGWNGSDNYSTYHASVKTAKDDHKPFTRIKYESILVRNATENGEAYSWSSSAYGWKSGTSTSDNYNIPIGGESVTPTYDTSYTRFVRVKSQGIGGEQPWKYISHVYAYPLKPTASKIDIQKLTGNVVLDVTFDTPQSAAHPIDAGGITLEYVIGQPVAGLELDENASIETAPNRYNTKTTNSDRYFYDTGKPIGTDKCVWVRLVAKHDNNESRSDWYLKYIGKLPTPENMSVTADIQNHSATVTVTNASQIVDSRLVVVCSDNGEESIVGVSSAGSGQKTIVCSLPSDVTTDATFSVYAVVGTVSGNSVTPYAGKKYVMQSDSISQSGNIPVAPSAVTAVKAEVEKTVLLTWHTEWTDATSAQISWSDNPLAWESNDEPSMYDIPVPKQEHWYISGLEEGKKWYFRIRSSKQVDEDYIYGAWSDVIDVDLRSAPNKPNVELSDTVITADGMTQAYWAYVTTDGTPQSYAEICEAIYVDEVESPSGNPSEEGWYEKDANDIYYLTADESVESGKTYYEQTEDGTLVYLQKFGDTNTAQHIDISASERGWKEGETHLICVRVRSESGINSEGWSDPVSLHIAARMTAEISGDSLVPYDLTEEGLEGTEYRLEELPLTLYVLGAGAGHTTVAIERAEDYPMDRPDESQIVGFKGETIALLSDDYGDSQITISAQDIIGHLDDGAKYILVATTSDDYGQVSERAEKEFVVKWAHQAVMPTGSVMMDGDKAVIIPALSADIPVGWQPQEGDVADIYRLSADKPQLVFSGAELGVAYIDPYPAINGGYRIVFRTNNGDYIVDEDEENGVRLAWIDLDNEFDYDKMIIDFGGDKAELYYNVDEDDNWTKDFRATTYLGGSIVGDWNPAVERESDISAVVIPIMEENTVDDLRRLAEYAGAVHVRTKSGSSYTANVNVKRTKSHEHFDTRYSYGLSITKVDAQGMEGMSLIDFLTERGDSQEVIGMKYMDYLSSLGYLLDENGDFIMDENGDFIITDDAQE